MLHRSVQENAANAVRFASVSDHFGTCIKESRSKSVWSKNLVWQTDRQTDQIDRQTDRDRKTDSMVLNLMLNSISGLITILKTNFFYS